MLALVLGLLAPTAASAAPSPPAAVGAGGSGQRAVATPGFDLHPDGTLVTVRGSGFNDAAGFDIATEGLYVALCVDNGPGVRAQPCVGGVDMTGGSGASAWVTNAPLPGVPPEAVTPVSSSGSFEVTLRVAAGDEFIDCLEVTCALYVFRDHRRINERDQDVRLPVRFAGQRASSTFTDVPNDYVHARAIAELNVRGIVQGTSATTFAPRRDVTRGQLASIIARTIGLEPDSRQVFDDVPNGFVHAGAINALARRGIVQGVTARTFDPNAPVRRDQAASLLARWLELPGVRPTFTDVPADYVHAGAIGALAREGIAEGFEDDTYRPRERVRRDQAASLLLRTSDTLAPPPAPAPEEPEPEEPGFEPEVQVSRTTGLDPEGDTITVTGSGFDPGSNASTRPPVTPGQPAGVYVVFGSFADTWQPSAGAPGGARTVLSQRWALPEPSYGQVRDEFPQVAGQLVLLEEDGTFEVDLEVAVDESATGNYGVYVYAGGGAAPNPDHELAVPLTFADGEPVFEPGLTVSRTTGLDPEGDTITVTGDGFDPGGNASAQPPVTSGQPAGVYVVFGSFADVWQPSDGAPRTARNVLFQRWALPQPSFDQVSAGFPSAAAQLVLLEDDGTFEVDLEVAVDDEATGNYGVYVYPGGGAINPAHELAVPLVFADGDPDVTDVTVDWGVRTSFRNYVTGSGGTITVSGGATVNADGTFRFGSSGTGTVDGDTVEVQGAGTVRFVAHGGGLDLAFSDPRIVLASDGTSRLYVDVVDSSPGGSGSTPGVHLADVATSSAGSTVTDGIVTWTAVPATLTADGSTAFAEFYPPGDALDPITVSYRPE